MKILNTITETKTVKIDGKIYDIKEGINEITDISVEKLEKLVNDNHYLKIIEDNINETIDYIEKEIIETVNNIDETIDKIEVNLNFIKKILNWIKNIFKMDR